MKEPLFLLPIFQERIWGGTALKDIFGYDIPSSHTGECWAISGHPNGQSKINNSSYKGKTLGELWAEKPFLFGNYPSPVFPLLTKILDANEDLSVQVHPNDMYAFNNENGELGKTECWYIINCAEDAEIILGHNAKTKEEFVSMAEKGEWSKLLRRVAIKPGDFFYVPSGTIHALCKGTLVLETQQSSDTTYRVYDYDRVDQQGRKRELHLGKAIEVSKIPHQDVRYEFAEEVISDLTITRLVKSNYFTVYKWLLDGRASLEHNNPFLLVSVIEGDGELIIDNMNYKFSKGDHFILPANIGSYTIAGNSVCIVSHP